MSRRLLRRARALGHGSTKSKPGEMESGGEGKVKREHFIQLVEKVLDSLPM
jgi:hypothetical protein